MVVTHFWAVEVHRASEHVPQWAALLAAGGIKRVRDLSLWRHAPGDLITYLRDSQSRGREGTNNEFPSEVELGYMCQLSESFRDQCEWVDEWTDSDLESAHATVHRPSERTSKSESWYRSPSALPRYCYEVLPEAVLLELNPVTSACDKNSTESVAWQTLADLASYEEVLCLRQYVPPTMERVVRVVAASSFEKEDNSAEALPACLGRHVSFRMTDDGVVEAAAGGTGGGAVSEADILRGVVAAYVPPTDEETMALWKVLLHSGQWQDLELHELREALTEE